MYSISRICLHRLCTVCIHTPWTWLDAAHTHINEAEWAAVTLTLCLKQITVSSFQRGGIMERCLETSVHHVKSHVTNPNEASLLHSGTRGVVPVWKSQVLLILLVRCCRVCLKVSTFHDTSTKTTCTLTSSYSLYQGKLYTGTHKQFLTLMIVCWQTYNH